MLYVLCLYNLIPTLALKERNSTGTVVGYPSNRRIVQSTKQLYPILLFLMQANGEVILVRIGTAAFFQCFPR